jgi:N-acetylglucosaminyltransferase
LDAVLLQSAPIERIIVVDDCSTDRTAELCRTYPAVEVIRTPQNAGSKARALNHVLPQCTTDLVMVVDGDATLASDYVTHILPAFCDRKVTSAAGCVLSKNVRTPAERGRNIELLFSSHFHRPIQNKAGAPLVIPGCATLYRLSDLREVGGWTSQTVCEDVDYTWVALLKGQRAVYVPRAIVWTIDPRTGPELGRQVNRWMSSVFQSVRLHWRELPGKPMLALWVGLCMLETLLTPFYWFMPFAIPIVFHVTWLAVLLWYIGGQAVLMLPILGFAVIRLRISPLKVLLCIPFWYYTWLFNGWYSLQAMIIELVLVPLHISEGMTIFKKGH